MSCKLRRHKHTSHPCPRVNNQQQEPRVHFGGWLNSMKQQSKGIQELCEMSIWELAFFASNFTYCKTLSLTKETCQSVALKTKKAGLGLEGVKSQHIYFVMQKLTSWVTSGSCSRLTRIIRWPPEGGDVDIRCARNEDRDSIIACNR